VASYLYEPPFFRDSSPFLKAVLGGWVLACVTTIQSGTPVNVTFGSDRANIGITGLQRPNLVGSVPKLNCQPNTAGTTEIARREQINCFDASAFALPAQFTFGNAPRNVLRGPRFSVTDLSLMKNIPIAGDARLQLRVEVFNVFNTVNYANPNASFGSAAFGRITALATGATMRQIQLGGKLLF
jgi:hypothetical protein